MAQPPRVYAVSAATVVGWLALWLRRQLTATVAANRSDDIEDGVGRPDGVDVLGPAGTAIITNGCNIHAGTVRQSHRPRRSIILWWGHGPQNYTPRGQARQITKRHNNGHDMALPARLPAHTEWGWLFSQEPLSAEENWVVNGINPEAAGVAARL